MTANASLRASIDHWYAQVVVAGADIAPAGVERIVVSANVDAAVRGRDR